MRNAKYEKAPASLQRQAAVFVDYENLYLLLSDRIDGRDHPDAFITELLNQLHGYLQDHYGARASCLTAYADFSDLQGEGTFIQRDLAQYGIEPRFVAGSDGQDAAELQLCVDVMDLLHQRPTTSPFVLVSGNRAYRPLVQALRRAGRDVLVVALEVAEMEENAWFTRDGLFLDAVSLLSETSRRRLMSGPGGKRPAPSSNGTPIHTAKAPARTAPAYRSVNTTPALRTLDIIEEFFGQYEEVYLTPLLRKLSELLDDAQHDPKLIISELEDAGAVWLEKRRGFPYDYTVLLVDENHPDVQQARQNANRDDYSEEDAYDDDDASYDDASYDDAYYDDADDYAEEYADDDTYEARS